MAADHCPNPAAIRSRACASVSASCPASERAERAAAQALAALHLGDNHVPPGPEPTGAAEIGLPLVTGDGRGLVADDRLHKLVFAGEVVRQLGPADPGR
jgi:hypothetical protein